jgi:hypothetical protein
MSSIAYHSSISLFEPDESCGKLKYIVIKDLVGQEREIDKDIKI